MAKMKIVYEGDLSTRCEDEATGQVLMTDAPKEVQGLGRTFSPTDLLTASLGSCVLTLMGMAAKRLKIDITGTQLIATKEMSPMPPRRVAKITLVISCPHTFDPDVIAKLETAAHQCPVHESLHPDIIQEFIFEWGS
jgi:putative redox protein